MMTRISIDADERWRPAQTKGAAWKRCSNKKGKVGDSCAVEQCGGGGGAGIQNRKKRRENLDCLAPLRESQNIF